jgi:hypothetical protein
MSWLQQHLRPRAAREDVLLTSLSKRAQSHSMHCLWPSAPTGEPNRSLCPMCCEGSTDRESEAIQADAVHGLSCTCATAQLETGRSLLGMSREEGHPLCRAEDGEDGSPPCRTPKDVPVVPESIHCQEERLSQVLLSLTPEHREERPSQGSVAGGCDRRAPRIVGNLHAGRGRLPVVPRAR